MVCPCLGGTGEWCGPCRKLIAAGEAAKRFLDEQARNASGNSSMLTREECERRDQERRQARKKLDGRRGAKERKRWTGESD